MKQRGLLGDTTYVGTNWLGANSPPAATGGATWHVGRGPAPPAHLRSVEPSVVGFALVSGRG